MYQNIEKHITNYVKASTDELQAFTLKLEPVNIKKKAFLLEPETFIHNEYFVEKGCLIAYYLDTKGNKHIVQFAIENWWIGDFDAYFNNTPSKLYIQAIEDATLFALSKKHFNQLLIEAPIFERYFRSLVTNAFIAQRKRILSTLHNSVKERYLEFKTLYPTIQDRVPNYHIANYLGMSAESLSRVRKQLKG
ncbi:Crp/Fnr family transcriptional regulator [Mangrovimonas spongiae]|uniref:Crp/Fnr family transcriptional regulator n=1 Tax=Mangrovimonas spongiae TaxID=2494697 RepID=A0A428JWZ9_9FLAO|nr:Crp/Fnr family transcriptional regulator [Mangrovimonas spongiae]RSK38615.1 Crp/Fnr family transcriptional regulator [Mangrovimonas spongiae]